MMQKQLYGICIAVQWTVLCLLAFPSTLKIFGRSGLWSDAAEIESLKQTLIKLGSYFATASVLRTSL